MDIIDILVLAVLTMPPAFLMTRIKGTGIWQTVSAGLLKLYFLTLFIFTVMYYFLAGSAVAGLIVLAFLAVPFLISLPFRVFRT